MDNQPNNRPARIQGQWKNLVNISCFILGAAALFLRLSGDDNFYWNFLPSTNEERGHRHLLRDISRRTAEANCNRFHRRPNRCNSITGCSHNGTACVPQHMMMMQFSNAASDICSRHNGKGRRCKRSGCAYQRSDKTCKIPNNECEPYNGRARVCNRNQKCVYNRGPRTCELMTETSVAMNSCTKKGYRQCKGDTTNCIWKNRVCSLKSSSGTTIQQQSATLATTTTTTTTKATQAAGSTTCWEWHPKPGQTGGAPVW